MNRLIQPCFPSKRVGKYISAAYSSERCFNFIYFKPHFNNCNQTFPSKTNPEDSLERLKMQLRKR